MFYLLLSSLECFVCKLSVIKRVWVFVCRLCEFHDLLLTLVSRLISVPEWLSPLKPNWSYLPRRGLCLLYHFIWQCGSMGDSTFPLFLLIYLIVWGKGYRTWIVHHAEDLLFYLRMRTWLQKRTSLSTDLMVLINYKCFIDRYPLVWVKWSVYIKKYFGVFLFV